MPSGCSFVLQQQCLSRNCNCTLTLLHKCDPTMKKKEGLHTQTSNFTTAWPHTIAVHHCSHLSQWAGNMIGLCRSHSQQCVVKSKPVEATEPGASNYMIFCLTDAKQQTTFKIWPLYIASKSVWWHENLLDRHDSSPRSVTSTAAKCRQMELNQPALI